MPLSAIAHERARLLAPRTRARLARVFTRYADGPSGAQYRPGFTGPSVEMLAAETVRDELFAVSALLRSGDASARGVARASYFSPRGF